MANIICFERSPDGRYLALSSQDGYCTLLEFEHEELGSPVSLSGLLFLLFIYLFYHCLSFLHSFRLLFPLRLFGSFLKVVSICSRRKESRE